VRLAVGDMVVYRSHGAGPVAARRSPIVLGKPQEVIVNGDPRLRRHRDSLAKVSSGNPIGLAEIIRDSKRRESTLSPKGAKSRLSPGERELLTNARRLLSHEIVLARGIQTEEADAWIDRQLGQVH
jgi:RNA polymerase-interacting CarD/CdnL/TRCF family regulator